MLTPECLDDLEDIARRVLPASSYAFTWQGTGDNHNLREQRNAWKRLLLMPRLMRDISDIDISSTVQGHRVSLPVCISPTAVHGNASVRGEKATVVGAHRVGTIYTQSAFSTFSMDDVTAACPDSLRFMHCDVFESRDVTVRIVTAAERLGYRAIVLTLDNAEKGLIKQRDVILHQDGRYDNWGGVISKSELKLDWTRPYASQNHLFKSTRSWKDVEFVRTLTSLPVIVKGVLNPADAVLAVKHGAKGIIVSNHGGRQLDCTPASADMLPHVLKAVADYNVEVYVDGGIRCGEDVVKALALGARAVFIGRPVIYGLAYKDEDGVVKAFDILRNEIMCTMANIGVRKLSQLSPDIVLKTTPSML